MKNNKIRLKNILILETGVNGGGSFESLYQYLKVVDRNKINPYIVFFNRNGFTKKYIELINELGIDVFVIDDLILSNKRSKWIRGILKIINYVVPILYRPCLKLFHSNSMSAITSIINEHDIQLIYLNVSIARDAFGVYVAKKSNLPCISHLRDHYRGNTKKFNKINKYVLKDVNKFVTYYIANSNSTLASWKAAGLEKRKLILVHNGINVEQLFSDNKFRKKYNLENKYIIGSIGRLVKYKNQKILIKAFAKLLEEGWKNSSLHLVLVGQGPEYAELKNLAIKLGVADKITFTGHIENAKSIISSFNIFILPSNNEAFGRVLLEAMLFKVPVIASNSGGAKEIVEDQVNGLLFKKGDSKELAKSIRFVITNNMSVENLINNGYKTVTQEFNINNHVKKINDIINFSIEE